MTLPASPLVGDQITVIDVAGNADSNEIVLARNGLKIMGLSEDFEIRTKHAGVTVVYTGSTYGWKLLNLG